MARKLRTVTKEQLVHIDEAIERLDWARIRLSLGGAHKAADAAAKALKSADGARRHARRCYEVTRAGCIREEGLEQFETGCPR